MFGVTPGYGFYIRHARGITFDNVEVTFGSDDARPAFVLDDVKNIEFFQDERPAFERREDVFAEERVGF